MEKGFVFLDEVLLGIRWDAKYATWDNFKGLPVTGYEINRIVGTIELALALKTAQKKAQELGFSLLLWDAYRPQRAVNRFIEWSKEPENHLTKTKHYPNINKSEIIPKGYVAEKSGHSRGSAIDLTLFKADTLELINMGGHFDFMDEISHHDAKGIKKEETQNRKLLLTIMESSGFNSYSYEWWHYTLKNEPYPDTYFDFPIS